MSADTITTSAETCKSTKVIYTKKNEEILVDDEDFDFLNQYTWHICDYGYARTTLPKNYVGEHYIGGKKVGMHRLIMNPNKNAQIDHANGIKLDNRKINLRICSLRENLLNRPALKTGTSGFKGVSWHKHSKKWISHIRTDYCLVHLGYFKDKVSAAKAYNDAAILHFGKYAFLNDIT